MQAQTDCTNKLKHDWVKSKMTVQNFVQLYCTNELKHGSKQLTVGETCYVMLIGSDH